MNLRKIRTKKNISRLELAKKAAVSVDTVRAIEERNTSPTLRTLTRLALALRVSVAELIA